MSCQLMNEYSTSIVQHNICAPPQHPHKFTQHSFSWTFHWQCKEQAWCWACVTLTLQQTQPWQIFSVSEWPLNFGTLKFLYLQPNVNVWHNNSWTIFKNRLEMCTITGPNSLGFHLVLLQILFLFICTIDIYPNQVFIFLLIIPVFLVNG